MANREKYKKIPKCFVLLEVKEICKKNYGSMSKAQKHQPMGTHTGKTWDILLHQNKQ